MWEQLPEKKPDARVLVIKSKNQLAKSSIWANKGKEASKSIEMSKLKIDHNDQSSFPSLSLNRNSSNTSTTEVQQAPKQNKTFPPGLTKSNSQEVLNTEMFPSLPKSSQPPRATVGRLKAKINANNSMWTSSGSLERQLSNETEVSNNDTKKKKGKQVLLHFG